MSVGIPKSIEKPNQWIYHGYCSQNVSPSPAGVLNTNVFAARIIPNRKAPKTIGRSICFVIF